MNKFQKVAFANVEEFLDFLPEDELQIVNFLRQLIHNCFLEYKEKLAYNVPFYYRNKRICCIWPASVPWGNLSQGVALAFVRAKEIDPTNELLGMDQRKTVGRIVIKSMDELRGDNLELIKFLLQEAYRIDSNL
ncbi:DUF1801 domain-containing protein [Flagellimonas allohymeniacidonis]|uniref:DUF1801 domain-containing protein n=1 Tax=Flagellimonas allohymeniacidonis TaxID=2517819 RepID=A0A4Q8QIV6_9FLAO|nr:DUF1801 domain-containing protein [Allomuricauda hymeniacidonis]TAI49208.1 DUF1801 domain-containing protein [Allomuricauda hymeniacidonis]